MQHIWQVLPCPKINGSAIRKIQILLSLLLLFNSFTFGQNNGNTFRFYSENIHFELPREFLTTAKMALGDAQISSYYERLEKSDYQPFLSQIQEYQKKFNLNDWLFFDMVSQGLSHYVNNPIDEALMIWFLMSKSGFDTRLGYISKHVFVYVYSKDKIYNVPMITEGDKTFYNITSAKKPVSTNGVSINLHPFEANSNGKPFGFYIKKHPTLSEEMGEKKQNFSLDGQEFETLTKYNKTMVDIMANYPLFDKTEYIDVPLSKAVEQTLLLDLKKIIKGKTDKEALEILVSYTRSAFQYKEDKKQFGKNKPMVAEEIFAYPFSDCEDRSAIFNQLVKSLLGLPTIVLAYDDHLTIAVATQKNLGQAIDYKGKNYYICDPTGPLHSKEVGKAPKGYEDKAFEILSVK